MNATDHSVWDRYGAARPAILPLIGRALLVVLFDRSARELVPEEVRPEEIGRRLAAGEVPIAAWASWEHIALPKAVMQVARWAVWCALITLALAMLLRPTTRLVPTDGSVVARGAVRQGFIAGGNTPAQLDSALTVGRQLAILRFDYDPSTVATMFRALAREATPAGALALHRALPRAGIEAIILGDSGTVQLREYGAGAFPVGLAPGLVAVHVPLVGRLRSRHTPIDGVKAGIRLGTTVTLTVRQTGGRWRLDDIKGELLDSSVVAAWNRYHMVGRPRPAVVIADKVLTGDSAVTAAWQRGLNYPNQN